MGQTYGCRAWTSPGAADTVQMQSKGCDIIAKTNKDFAMSGKKYKSGDTIICVVVPYYGGFTVGKEYKVITTYAGKLGLLWLKDDNGNESKHLSQYFKLKD